MNHMRKMLAALRCDSSDYILVISWLLCAVSIPLLLAGFFIPWIMLPIYGLLIGIALYGLITGRITFPMSYVLIAIVTLFFLSGVMFLRGFYTGDGPAYWLPYARSMVENHTIVPFIRTQDGATAREPFLPIMLSSGLFFGASAWFYGWVPIVFTLGTLFFMMRWLRSWDIAAVYQRWALLIFLCAPLVAFWSWNILEEAPILFFFTAFFFYADRYRDSQKDSDFILLTLALCTALLTRYISLVLCLPFAVLWLQSQKKMQKLLLLCFASFPFLLWIIRNCIVYHSPFFPLFSSVFGGPYALYQAHSHFLGSLSLTLAAKIRFVITHLTFELPILLLGMWALYREKRFDYLAVMVILLGAISSIFFSETSATRYFYPCIGVLTVYGIHYIAKEKKTIALLPFILVLLIASFSIELTQSTSQYIASVEHLFRALLPLCNLIMRYRWLVALVVVVLMCMARLTVEQARLSILSLLSIGILHLRFIENKSWVATWPLIIALVLLTLLLIWKRISAFSARALVIVVVGGVLAVTWGQSVVYAAQNGGLSFNSVSRVYATQDKIAREIDRREQGSRDFYLITESPSYYVWNMRFPVVTFRSFNFNYITHLGIEQARSASELRDVLKAAKIKYLIYEGDEALPAYEQFDTGYINAHNTLYQIARDNPNLFPAVFTTTDQEHGIQSVLYQIY